MRLPPLVAFALVLALAACAAPEGDASSPADDADADSLTVSVSDFMIEPSDLAVEGTTVTIDVVNDGEHSKSSFSAYTGKRIAGFEPWDTTAVGPSAK